MRKSAKCLLGAAIILLTCLYDDTRGGHFVTLREGTPVIVQTTENLDPAGLAEGEKVLLVVAEKVIDEGVVLIEKGASVETTAVLETSDGQDMKNLMVLGTQAADGQQVKLRAKPEPPDASTDGGDTSRPQGLSLGDDRLLPAGTRFTVYVADSYLVEE